MSVLIYFKLHTQFKRKPLLFFAIYCNLLPPNLKTKGIAMRSMLKARILFVPLLSQLLLSITANATQVFKQAYAPIDVSGITIFIPIELIPAPPTLLIIDTTATDYILEWSMVSGATRYIVEYKLAGQWVVHNSNVTGNSYTISKDLQATEFRVITCQQFGCSTGKNVDNTDDSPLQIRSFLSAKYHTQQDERVNLSWNVVGATNVQLTSNKGLNYNNLALTGTTSVTTDDLTTFTLIATGFSKQNQQQLSIIKAEPAPVFTASAQSIYLQPLYDLGLQPIERSLYMGHNRRSYVATYDQKLFQVADTANGNWEWVINLPGLMANKPLLLAKPETSEQYLFFGLSNKHLDGHNSRGKVCRFNISSSYLACINLPNNIIASPIIYQQRLFQVDVTGILYEFSPFSVNFSEYLYAESLETEGKKIRVLTTPQIDSATGAIIVRSENELHYFPLPASGAQAAEQINSEPTIKANSVWSKQLD